MAPSVEHRCTECGTVVGRGPAVRAAVGRPFDECPRCRAFVQRPPFDEWALLDASDKAACVGRTVVPALAVGLVPALGYGVYLISTDRTAERLVLAILLGAGLVLALAVRIPGLVNSVKRSRRRMADPMYRAKLVEYGMASREHA